MKRLGPTTKTQRGFEKVEFKDLYGCACSLQESSLATERAIWVGIDDANPLVLASQAAEVGVKTTATTGWVPYPIPESVLLHTRMHMNAAQVKALIRHLQRWVDDGTFKQSL